MNKLKEWNMQCFLLLLVLLISLSTAQAREPLYYFQVDHRYDYRTALLELALSYTSNDKTEESISLLPKANIPMARATYLMARNKIRGVVSLATTHEREAELLAIKIPIMAGILGMRVLLIHKSQQQQFSSINDKEQLKDYVAGFGEHWGDLSILKENGITVLPVAKYSSLFNMLNAQRFDFFPRGVNEIFSELETYKEQFPDLSIEKSLAIYYPYPVYFFVAKQDEAIAQRIESGLEKALADGRFKQLFLRHHKDLLQKLNFGKRAIFNLSNDSLPKDAQIDNMDWWLQSKAESDDSALQVF